MTTSDMVETQEMPVEADDALAAQLAAVYSLTPDQFLGLKVADRDLTLFLLLREIAGTLASLEQRVNEYEDKARALATPQGMQELVSKFMGGGNGKGLNPATILAMMK